MKTTRYGRSHPRIGFTPQEDCLLLDLVAQFGNDSWTTIASYMENRNARQCKDRYTSYLSPTINKAPFTEEEDNLLKEKYNEIGPKWVKISKYFPNRTDISVKCRWAVLNRRDMKSNEKNLNIHSKSSKTKLNSLSSSSIEKADFVNKLSKRKNRNEISKNFSSSMTLRKRKPKKIDYNEDEDDEYEKFDIDDDYPKSENDKEENEDDSKISAFSSPTSLSSSIESINSSTENSPNISISNNLTKQTVSHQNQSRYESLNDEKSLTSIFSINSDSVFDIFSFLYNDNDIFFDSMFNNQMDIKRNDINNDFKNPTENFIFY